LHIFTFNLHNFILSLSLYDPLFSLFFFNDTPTTEIYTLSLHDALPISRKQATPFAIRRNPDMPACSRARGSMSFPSLVCSGFARSEEHTSELQSRSDLVCRLLLEKKKKKKKTNKTDHKYNTTQNR